jgi:hypothetical protein
MDDDSRSQNNLDVLVPVYAPGVNRGHHARRGHLARFAGRSDRLWNSSFPRDVWVLGNVREGEMRDRGVGVLLVLLVLSSCTDRGVTTPPSPTQPRPSAVQP